MLKSAQYYLNFISSFDERSLSKVIEFNPSILNLIDEEGDTIFHNLWKFARLKLLSILFEQFKSEIDFNYLNNLKLNTLSLCVYQSDLKTLDLLLSLPRGEQIGHINLFQFNSLNYSILDLATWNHDCQVLKKILQTDIAQSSYIKKAIPIALNNKNYIAVSLLEKALIDNSIVNNHGYLKTTKI